MAIKLGTIKNCILLSFLILVSLLQISNAINCYACQSYISDGVELVQKGDTCKDFRRTNNRTKYIKECPHQSTGCIQYTNRRYPHESGALLDVEIYECLNPESDFVNELRLNRCTHVDPKNSEEVVVCLCETDFCIVGGGLSLDGGTIRSG